MKTGATIAGWPVSIAADVTHNHVYSGLAYNKQNNMLYVTTASYCDIQPWQGRIAAINAGAAALVATFFPSAVKYGGSGSGGGIWGPAAAAIEASTNDVFVVTGNSDNSWENAAYGDHIVHFDAMLSAVKESNNPKLDGGDVDFGATPMLFKTPGCSAMVVAKNKSGILAQWQNGNINNDVVASVKMAPTTVDGNFIGLPAFSPLTNFVYVSDYTNNGSYVAGMNALSMSSDCKLKFQWGTPANVGRSGGNTPTSTPTIGNGVVYFAGGLGKAVYAFDAATGTPLWNSGSTIQGPAFAAPMIDGHLYVGSWDHNLYAFGVEPAIRAQARAVRSY